MVLILVAVLTLVFAAFLALAIDASQVANSQHKQQKTAEFAALAALTGYQNATVTATDAAGKYRQRLEAAVDRAEQIVALEANNLRLGTFGPQLNRTKHELRETTGRLGRENDAAGTITPGIWYFEEPAEGCSDFDDVTSECPCKSAVWRGACFRPNSATDTGLTAFEVTLNTKSGSPIRYVFGQVLGASGVAISSKGRASVKPRISLTAIDLSLSITGDDNIDWDDLPSSDPRTNFATSSSYVFPLDETDANSRCAGEPDYQNPCIKEPGGVVPRCKFKVDSHFGPMWYNLTENRGDRDASYQKISNPPLYKRTKHFRNDYSCWIVDGKHYLIDTSQHEYDDDGDGDSDGTYYGPEPFISILSSFGQALDEVKNRTVPGDRIGLIGFDQDADMGGPRTFRPTDPSDDAGWQEMLDLTNVTGVNDLRGDEPGAEPNEILYKRIHDHRFFPRPPDSFTDIAGALFAAAKAVDSTSLGTTGSIDITLLTDGLSNVLRWGDILDTSTGTFTMNEDRLSGCVPNDRFISVWNGNCWWEHNVSIYEAINLVTWDFRFWRNGSPAWEGWRRDGLKSQGWVELAKRGYRINIGLFSKDVQPHVLIKRSKTEPTKCLGDLEARKDWRKMFVSYDDDDNGYWNTTCYGIIGAPDAPSCPYTVIADVLYAGLVLPTGGIFQPVRKPCNPDTIKDKLSWDMDQNSCAAGALEQKLDSELCAKFTEEWEAYGRIYDFTPGLQEDLRPTIQSLIAAGVADNSTPGILEDGKGEVTDRSGWGPYGVASTRTICDTKCRTPEQQLREMYKTIFETNPYVLVRSDT